MNLNDAELLYQCSQKYELVSRVPLLLSSWGLVIERFAPHKGIEDSLGFSIPRRGFRIPGTGFRILCQWNLDSEFQFSVGFRIPQANISQIQESGFPCMGRKDIGKEVATKSLLKPPFLHSTSLR